MSEEWQEITLRVPKSIDLRGFEKVAEWRSPKAGEPILRLDTGEFWVPAENWGHNQLAIILTPKPPPYEWPTINGKPMGGWGFVCDKYNEIYWHEQEPEFDSEGTGRWWSRGASCMCMGKLNIPRPPLKPVEVFRNPHYQAKGGAE